MVSFASVSSVFRARGVRFSLLALLLCGLASLLLQPLPSAALQSVGPNLPKAYQKQVLAPLAKQQLALLYLHMPRCGACLRVNPVVEQLKAKHTKNLKVFKLNVYDAATDGLNATYQVNATPTFLLFNRQGQLLAQQVGGGDLAGFEAWLKPFLKP
jgi:thiol-disulfide isomerase/thioredoxin